MFESLDLGCGRNKLPGALGVDLDPTCEPDLVLDLDQQPWPLADSSFTQVRARHVIEHVRNAAGFLSEVWRVSRPDAQIEIVTPHFSNPMAFCDPTHRRALSARFIEFYVDPQAHSAFRNAARAAAHLAFESEFDLPQLPGSVRFRVLRRHLTFPRIWRFCGVAWLANRWLSFYEFYLSGIFRARDIELDLEVLKDFP
ncbi:MAG: methyltransferase domain-containing protein [Candidatus Alcyoniella australis]|nr:methyltransferase domain-containing protein [Candidatus Alcyoniella australis]